MTTDCEHDNGHHYCKAHNEGFTNNFGAQSHEFGIGDVRIRDDGVRCEWLWICHDCGEAVPN